MKHKGKMSFLERLRRKLFEGNMDHEIFDRIMPHVVQEKD